MEVLTATDAKSTTLASYKMLALCHLLHDEMCIDSLLEEPQTYNRVLLQCLTSAGLQNPVRPPSHQWSTTSQANTIISGPGSCCGLQHAHLLLQLLSNRGATH